MFYAVLLLVSLIKLSRSESDCGCDQLVWDRQYCVSSPFARTQTECENAGCCYALSGFATDLRCYERDARQCAGVPGFDDDDEFDVCIPASPLQQCGFGLALDFCEARGCCYIPDFSPYCFVAGSSRIEQLTSSWGQWSRCSSICSSGTRSRTRRCLAQTSFECNQRGLNLAETELCNVNICNNWSSWQPSPCSVTCGSGTITYTRSCRGFGTLGSRDCNSIAIVCNRPSCSIPTTGTFSTLQIRGTWSRWQPWQVCDNPCGLGKQSRTRVCTINGVVASPQRCPLDIVSRTSTLQTRSCNIALCSSWTNWAQSTRCTETCGSRATRLVTRRCRSPANANFESSMPRSCRSRQEPCILYPCPSPRNPNAVTITSSTQTSQAFTTRIFTLPQQASFVPPSTEAPRTYTIDWAVATVSTPTRQPRVTTPRRPATTTSPRAVTNLTVRSSPTTQSTSTEASITPPTTTPFTTVNSGFVTTTPSFWESTMPITPPDLGLPTDTIDTDASWLPWSTWSTCSRTCGAGIRVRTRICAFNNGTATESESNCGSNATGTDDCDNQECVISTPAPPTTTETTGTTPSSTESPTEDELLESPRPTETSLPAITKDLAAEWGDWGPWSECSSRCSTGFTTRLRPCQRMGSDVEATECSSADPGSMFDEALCNTDLCSKWTDWRSSECSITCNHGDDWQGVIQRRRGCLVSETRRAEKKCYLVSDICNATEPCPDPSTTSQTITTTATATTEISSRPSPLTDTPSSTRSSGDIWGDWGDWAPCSSSCAPGIQNRVRQCFPGVPKVLCTQGGFMSRECNIAYCTGWSEWRAMPCDKTCGENAIQLRRRICLSGQPIESLPESCYRVSRRCESTPQCESTDHRPQSFQKLDILFLVDSSTHVDDCDSIKNTTGLTSPIRTPQLTNKIAPTYARIKKFMTDFANGWQGISNNGTRVAIQLISGLCNGMTRANLFVEKRYDETHEFLKEYISEMPYICGDFQLDWAMQCSYLPVMTERYGDRKDVPNIVVAIMGYVPTASLPREQLLRSVVSRLQTKATILSATATKTESMDPISSKRYFDHTRKLACQDESPCSRFLGSIWDSESSAVADKIRDALKPSGES